jgi:hypothetical protein
MIVHFTVTHLCNVVEQVATIAFEDVKVGPDLPVDFSPRDAIGFTDECYKLFQVPRFIDNVFSSDLAIAIDIGLCLRAV